MPGSDRRRLGTARFASPARVPRVHARGRGAVRLTVLALATLLLLVAPQPTTSQAWVVPKPEVKVLHGAWNKMDNTTDELRVDMVVKVPKGYVGRKSGALQVVGWQGLRIGFQHGHDVPVNLQYINSYSADGAAKWAANQKNRFTIHEVIEAGPNDYLVITAEGDIDIRKTAAHNKPGGEPYALTFYFGAANGLASSESDTSWMLVDGTTTAEVPVRVYDGSESETNVSGPLVQAQYDSMYSLWSGGQANWGQNLDHGLNGTAPGVLPPNSVVVDLVNHAYADPSSGPEGSVSDSFWYAWVHEDGSLVTSVNTAPIHVTGVAPHKGPAGSDGQLVKNQPGRAPTLAWTPEQGAQGLTTKVAPDGSIDFNGAGGSGYYRLMVWPESRNPDTVSNPAAAVKAPLLSYTPGDLFTASGMLTTTGAAQAATVASAYYNFTIATPPAPVITVPEHGMATNQNTSVRISGTGVPGSTITLKFKSGAATADFDATDQRILVDGDHVGVNPDADVIVGDDGTWSYTYTPAKPLADGQYSVVAAQTEHNTVYERTSPPSNPNDPNNPTRWGVTFTVDTLRPWAPTMTCPALPSDNAQPTFSGTVNEAGSKVNIYQNGELLGSTVATGKTWSFTPEKPLANGTHKFTATAVDAAGNESAASALCTLTVRTDVPVTGAIEVADVVHGMPSLPSLPSETWEVTASDGKTTSVISGGAEFELQRGTSYKIAERLRTGATPPQNARLYSQQGRTACFDANGGALPDEVFDAAASTLTVGPRADVAEPIACTITKQTAHVSLVSKRVGGVTSEPAAGWRLTATGSDGENAFELGSGAPAAEAKPMQYELSGSVPEGLSLVGMQQLDLSQDTCAAAADDPMRAPESCWIDASAEAAGGQRVEQGKHSVFRLVAATPGDLPTLPLTGGLGTHLFTIAGGAALALAVLGSLLRRPLQHRFRTFASPHQNRKDT